MISYKSPFDSETDVLQIFLELVKIPSPSGEESAVRTHIQKMISRYADVMRVDAGGNLYASFHGEGRPILLCGHMDTVQPAGVQIPSVDQAGMIKAQGNAVLGADDKAGLSAIVAALMEYRTQNIRHRACELLFTVREETVGGIREFDSSILKSKECVIADVSKPVGTIVTSAAYVCGFSIRVLVPGSHVAYIDQTTVHPLTFLQQLLKDFPIGKLSELMIVNIAQVKMGENYNSVPPNLYLTGEIRSFDVKMFEKLQIDLKACVKKLDQQLGSKCSLEFFPYCNGYVLQQKDLGLILRIFTDMEIKPRLISTFGVGDFNILNEWGIRTINIGDGAIEPHTTRERVSHESLKKLKEIFRRLLRNED